MKLIDMYYFGKGMEAPFLNLLEGIADNKDPADLTGAELKLLKTFILHDTAGVPLVNVAFPCFTTASDTCHACHPLLHGSNYDRAVERIVADGDIRERIRKMRDESEEAEEQ
jgi:hypothetical protein